MPTINEVKYSREIGLKTKGTKYQWLACVDCGKERWVRIIRNKSQCLRCKSCANKITSTGRFGEKSGSWKGGKRVHQHYLSIRLYPSDFFYLMMKGQEYVYKHRLIMAKYLGRCLSPWEVVHHKNGIRNDNRLENLVLLSRQEHMKIHRNKLEREV